MRAEQSQSCRLWPGPAFLGSASITSFDSNGQMHNQAASGLGATYVHEWITATATTRREIRPILPGGRNVTEIHRHLDDPEFHQSLGRPHRHAGRHASA